MALVVFLSDFMQNGFELLLEDVEGLGAHDRLGLFLAIDGIGDQKTRRAINAGGLPICSILLNPVLELATVITTIELVRVQTGLFGDGF